MIFISDFSSPIGQLISQRMRMEEQPFCIGVSDPQAVSELYGAHFDFRRFDVQDASTFVEALAGCDQIFLEFPANADLETFEYFIHYLRQTALQHIVYLSAKDALSLPFTPHHRIEVVIRQTDIPYTIIRPSYYMQHLNMFMRDMLRDHAHLFAPAGIGKTSMIDARDVATVVMTCLENPATHLNKMYTISGEEAYNFYDIASLLGEELETDIMYTNPSIQFFRSFMIQHGWTNEETNDIIKLHVPILLGLADETDNHFMELIGNHPITLRQYIKDYLSHWGNEVEGKAYDYS
ncbi:NmrA family NAD(P)-binding protein [Exiguobacterium acetylicum]